MGGKNSGKKDERTQDTNLLQRIYTQMQQIKDVAEELETADLTLVAHILILDRINQSTQKK